MSIVAIDLGKFKSSACIYHTSNGKHQFVGCQTIYDRQSFLTLRRSVPDRAIARPIQCVSAGYLIARWDRITWSPTRKHRNGINKMGLV